MVTVAKRRDPEVCDVCEEPARKVYAFGTLILGLDLRSGDVVVHEHKICLSCLSVVVHLALENQLDQEE
jgi:hypothetical protein